MTLYDSQGYEIGTDEHKYMKEVLKVIDDKISAHPDEMQEHIHEVWYCVSAANNRFFEADEKMIRKIRQKYKIPVMVILTKVDCVDEDGIIYLKKAILEKIPDISIFTYACDEKTADWDEETRKKYVQKDEIIVPAGGLYPCGQEIPGGQAQLYSQESHSQICRTGLGDRSRHLHHQCSLYGFGASDGPAGKDVL